MSSFPSVSIPFPRSQFVVYHSGSSGSSAFSIVHFFANTFKVLLCRLTYSVPSSFLHFYAQTGGGALFLYARHITCICHIPLIPLSFSRFLFQSFAPVMRMLMMFSFGQSCISTNQSLIHYIAWVFHFCCLFLFCPSVRIFLSFFHPSLQ